MAERRSYLKEILVAVVVALAAGGSAPWWVSAITDRPPKESARPGAPSDTIGELADTTGDAPDARPCTDPSVSLSRGSGPSGTQVKISGSGFPSDERVDIRFHTEALPPARTEADGRFSVDAVIPGTFDVFAPQTFEIRATTKPTICNESAPFRLTK